MSKEENKYLITDFQIPLVIGITGHRDLILKDLNILEKRVAEIYEQLIQKYPNTPIILLTPLADGADRIVAKIALSSKFNNKITTCVPLPMEISIYKDTFAGGLDYTTKEESIKEFDSLLDKVNNQKNNFVPKTIPMIFNKAEYISATSEQQRQIRREQYSTVGEYIALHSNILIAMYDGDLNEEAGGTSEIVRKKLSGEYDYFLISKEDVSYSEKGIVYQITTPRTKNDKIESPYVIKRLFPDESIKLGLKDKYFKTFNIFSKFQNILSSHCVGKIDFMYLNSWSIYHKQIECFNSNMKQYFLTIKEEALKDAGKYDLKSSNSKDNLLIKNIFLRRSSAYLADRVYHPLIEKNEKVILLLISFMIFILSIKASFHNFTFHSFIEPFYVFIAIFIYIIIVKFNSIKNRQEDYRAIAEGLRVQIAWNIANINDSSTLYYLSHQQSELGWIRSAMRGMNIFYLPTDKNNIDKESLVKIHNTWIDSQIDYFKKNIIKLRGLEQTSSKKIRNLFIIFIISSIIFGLQSFFIELPIYLTSSMFVGLSYLDILKILLINIPITFMAYYKMKELFDSHSDLLKEYQLSLDIFKKAKKLLQKENINKQNVIKNLGIEALRENSSWIINRRTKEYTIPV